MIGMRFLGVHRRSREARAALNRLRWEIDQAIAEGRASDAASLDLAEAVGIMSNILATLGEAIAEEPTNEVGEMFGPVQDQFVQQIAFFTKYHNVAR